MSRRVQPLSAQVHYRRGKSVCPNKLEVRLDTADAAVLDAIEAELLPPTFVEMVVRKVLARQVPVGPALDATRAQLTKDLADEQRQLEHLVEGLALTGVAPSVIAAIKARESRKSHIEAELLSLEPHEARSKAGDAERPSRLSVH